MPRRIIYVFSDTSELITSCVLKLTFQCLERKRLLRIHPHKSNLNIVPAYLLTNCAKDLASLMQVYCIGDGLFVSELKRC